MLKLDFLKDLDYFVDYQSIKIILDIIDNYLLDDRRKYNISDLKSAYQISDRQARSIFEILDDDEIYLFIIIDRILKIKNDDNVNDINKQRYIIDLFAFYDPDGYRDISDKDLYIDVAKYGDDDELEFVNNLNDDKPTSITMTSI